VRACAEFLYFILLCARMCVRARVCEYALARASSLHLTVCGSLCVSVCVCLCAFACVLVCVMRNIFVKTSDFCLVQRKVALSVLNCVCCFPGASMPAVQLSDRFLTSISSLLKAVALRVGGWVSLEVG
jgi:hypothetical protein